MKSKILKNEFEKFGAAVAPQCEQSLVVLKNQTRSFELPSDTYKRFEMLAKGARNPAPMGVVFPWLFAELQTESCQSWEALASYWYALYISSVLLDEMQDEAECDVAIFTNILLLYNHALSGLTKHLTSEQTREFYQLMNSAVIGQKASGPSLRSDSIADTIIAAQKKNDLLTAYALSVCALNSQQLAPSLRGEFIASSLTFVRSFILVIQILDDLTDLEEDCSSGIQSTCNFNALNNYNPENYLQEDVMRLPELAVSNGDVANALAVAIIEIDAAEAAASFVNNKSSPARSILKYYRRQLQDISTSINKGIAESQIINDLANLRMPS